jgi:hypothetical protein
MFVIIFVNSSYHVMFYCIYVNNFDSFSTLYCTGRRHMSARVMAGSIFCEMSDKSLWTTFYHKLEDFGPSFWAHKHFPETKCFPSGPNSGARGIYLSTGLSCTLLSYIAPYWATMHPPALWGTLMSYAAPYTVKRVDEVVRHPHLVTQDQNTQVSNKFFDIPVENFTINIELFQHFSQVSN